MILMNVDQITVPSFFQLRKQGMEIEFCERSTYIQGDKPAPPDDPVQGNLPVPSNFSYCLIYLNMQLINLELFG